MRVTKDLSNVDLKELSRDQQYLLEICNAINAGECSVDLSLRNPGCLNHSRWLITAKWILRLHVSDKNPSKVQAMVMVRYPCLCSNVVRIKITSFFIDGARHFHQTVARSRYSQSEAQKNYWSSYNYWLIFIDFFWFLLIFCKKLLIFTEAQKNYWSTATHNLLIRKI